MIYRLASDLDHYMTFFIEPDELSSKMGNDPRLYFGPIIKLASEYWVKPDVTFYQSDEYPQLFKVPDITLWGSFLVLNAKAYKALNDQLKPFGEFLPANCEGLDYYLFNVMTFDEDNKALDQTGSEYVMFEGRRSHLAKLAFKEDKLEGALLFRSEYEGYNCIFCSDAFKQLIDAVDLKGLLFKTDLEGLI